MDKTAPVLRVSLCCPPIKALNPHGRGGGSLSSRDHRRNNSLSLPLITYTVNQCSRPRNSITVSLFFCVFFVWQIFNVSVSVSETNPNKKSDTETSNACLPSTCEAGKVFDLSNWKRVFVPKCRNIFCGSREQGRNKLPLSSFLTQQTSGGHPQVKVDFFN